MEKHLPFSPQLGEDSRVLGIAKYHYSPECRLPSKKLFLVSLQKMDAGTEKGQTVLREKCPYSEIFWSVFSRIRPEYGEILSRKTRSRKTPNRDTFHAVLA